MKNQGCLLMAEGGRELDINRQSLLRDPKVFCRRSLTCQNRENYHNSTVKAIHQNLSEICPKVQNIRLV